jgi:hypothetical protein
MPLRVSTARGRHDRWYNKGKGLRRPIETAKGVQQVELSWPVNPLDFSKQPI